MPLNRKIAYYLFYVGLFSLSAAIPVSKFVTSVGMFLISIAWFVNWNWKEKWTILKTNWKPILISASLFLIFVLGMIHTENTKYGLKDLRIKAPLFILPVVLGLSGFKISRKVLITSFVLISASALVASVIGVINFYLKLGTENEITNLRKLSPFISLIRLSLILCFGYGIALWGIFKLKSKRKWWLIIPALWIVIFLGFSESLTGIVLLPIISTYFLFYLQHRNRKLAYGFGIVLLLLGVFCIYELNKIASMVFDDKDQVVLSKSVNGREYFHNLESNERENGYLVYRNIVNKEVHQEWNKRSDVHLFKEGERNYKVKDVLLRYLSSKGYNKDSVGMSKLTIEEIRAIENGVTNEFYVNRNSISKRVHSGFKEIRDAIESNKFSGSSLAARFIYAKTGIYIWFKSFFFGEGTGDVKDSFLKEYDKMEGKEGEFDKRSHNQLITVGVALGAVGLILFISIWLYIFNHTAFEFKYLVFLAHLILVLSMFWEDTLETQAGVGIFALWVNLLLFAKNDEKLEQ